MRTWEIIQANNELGRRDNNEYKTNNMLYYNRKKCNGLLDAFYGGSK